jgi:hypothetical protein
MQKVSNRNPPASAAEIRLLYFYFESNIHRKTLICMKRGWIGGQWCESSKQLAVERVF